MKRIRSPHLARGFYASVAFLCPWCLRCLPAPLVCVSDNQAAPLLPFHLFLQFHSVFQQIKLLVLTESTPPPHRPLLLSGAWLILTSAR